MAKATVNITLTTVNEEDWKKTKIAVGVPKGAWKRFELLRQSRDRSERGSEAGTYSAEQKKEIEDDKEEIMQWLEAGGKGEAVRYFLQAHLDSFTNTTWTPDDPAPSSNGESMVMLG